MRKNFPQTEKENSLQDIETNKNLHVKECSICKIHNEEIKWICFNKHSDSDGFCEENLLCIYCRNEHDKFHFNKIESLDFIKSDYIKKIIQKETERIQRAKELKSLLCKLKCRTIEFFDIKLECLNKINENYEFENVLNNLEKLNKILNEVKIHDMNLNELKFYDEVLNMIICLKSQDSLYLPSSDKNFKNSDSLRENNKICNNYFSSDKYIKRTFSLNLDENESSKNILSNAPNYRTKEGLNVQVLDELLEKIISEFDSIKNSLTHNLQHHCQKFLWDENNLAENTKLNLKADTITIKKSMIHNAARSKQIFFKGNFSSNILIEEMNCCGGIGIGFDKFNPNGRRDVIFNNYIYFSDGKIAGNINITNLPKFKEGDIITVDCDINIKEITFFLNCIKVYTIKNAEFKNEVYIIGDLDGGKLKFIS